MKRSTQNHTLRYVPWLSDNDNDENDRDDEVDEVDEVDGEDEVNV